MWTQKIMNRLLKRSGILSDKVKVPAIIGQAKKMTKTERIVNLLLEISQAKDRTLSYEFTVALLGDSYATQVRLLNELLEGGALPPVLVKIGDGPLNQCSYKLNSKIWEEFALGSQEGRFYFEAFKQIGKLLGNEYMEANFSDSEASSRIKALPRKFIYLSKIQAKPFNENTQQIVDNIIDALIDDKLIEICYKPSGEFQQAQWREVKPLTICQYRDDLYLLCQKNDNLKWIERCYKICRIEACNITDRTFIYPDHMEWNPEEKFKRTSGLIAGPESTCTIRVYGDSRWVFEEKDFFNTSYAGKGDDYNDYTMIYTSLNEFVGQLFVYAQDIVVLEGDEVRDEFIKKAESCLNLNIEQKKKSQKSS